MKIYLTILALFISVFSLSQMNIENIKTDKDAIQFVSQFGEKNNMEWRKVSFNDLNGMFSQNKRKKRDLVFLDSLTNKKWIKSDFNNDGRPDLIFFGRFYTQLGVLSFISKGDSIECNDIGSSHSVYYPSGIGEFQLGMVNFLTISSFVRNEIDYDIRNSYKTDTLIYRFGGFVEPDFRELPIFKFDSIVYRISATWMSLVNIPKITIYADGKVKLLRNKSNYNRDSALWTNFENVSSGHIDGVKELEGILGYINFWNLKTNNPVGYISDLGASITTVYYNGKSKSISDYGSHSTYGLNLLYRKFNRMKSKSFPKSAE